MTTAPCLSRLDREEISAKLRLIATIIDSLPEWMDKGMVDDDVFFALTMMLSELSTKVLPEGHDK